MNAPVVAVSRRIPAPGIEPLVAAGLDVRYRDVDAACPPDELAALVAPAAGLFCLLSERIDGALLDAAPNLRIVANMAVGYDNVDVVACAERGVVVTNTPDVLTDATADLTWALLLAVARRVAEGDRLVRGGNWTGWRPGELLGTGLGLVMPNTTVAVQNALPWSLRGVGTAMLTFFRSMGGLVGVAASSAVIAAQVDGALAAGLAVSDEIGRAHV